MARPIPSWIAVTGLTASALVTLSVLAFQADGSPAEHSAGKARTPSAGPSRPSGKPRPPKSPAVPGKSGTGKRVVYSLSQDRAWLVDSTGAQIATFPVWPGTLDPALGEQRVYARKEATTGGDGVAIEHVVYFGTARGIGFSAAVDGSSPKPVPGRRTGGIRVRPAEGDRLWRFSAVGTTVFVVR
ncbi:hypothetical protein [Wenjunlia tyrosinilytica]|uniref:L,D-transpeptidase n=1 Tax=Wenjunlia tyrosinilytica TaxID=1544741 RepID=A0A917ZMC3_9ACTN|nr:hypothetical protein [Wenjunlia tyrosinilytica]GGO85065.1 L,D-transpeptidase [Wenjunlia tyrosinilytica]